MRILLFVAAAAVALSTASMAADTKTISSVEVQEDTNVTRIVLRGAEDPIYTAFMREDPRRLIVELPEVEFSGVNTPIEVSNGTVSQVTLGAFGDPRVALSIARISIGLDQAAEYELVPDGDELVIAIWPSATPADPTPVAQLEEPVAEPVPAAPTEDARLDGAALESDAAPSDEEASETVQPAETAEPTETAATAASAEESASQVSRLLNVVPGDEGIEVVADGPIDNIDSFTLEDPSRLVMDFWGVENAVWPARQAIDTGDVEQVRIGAHADKVRLVLDLRTQIRSHVVEPTPRGVLIKLEPDSAADGEEDAAAEAESESLPAASEEEGVLSWLKLDGEDAAAGDEPEEDAAEPSDDAASDDAEGDEASDQEAAEEAATWSEPAEVESVHFESLSGVDRVVVSLSHPIEAQIVEPDDATLIVMLPQAKVDPEVERRVDTKEFGGSVELFSVFKTPDVPYDEVRVVLKRRTPVSAHLDWDENQLHIEVAHSAGSTASAAESSDGEPVAGESPATPEAESSAAASPEATTASLPAPAGQLGASDDPFYLDGPADPAAIDVLEEGGFSEEKEYTGRRISLDFKDADIGNILRLIAEVSDLNVIAGEEVKGVVTIRLVDVPWDQALDVILLTKGLGFVRVGNVLRIAPLETLKLEAEARLQDRRAKEKLEDLIVKLQPVNYANVGEVKDLVKKLLSKRGTVNTDKRTNTLIIKDIPSVVQEATALVKAIDTATPQVLIESKIVEANLTFTRALGAIWGLGYNSAASTSSTPGGGEDLHLGGDPQLTNFIAANPIFEAANGLLNLGVLGLDDHIQLDLILQAAEANNKGKVISSPRVVTLDNREATIKQGVAIKFEAATRDKITISFIDAVLELKVTPHITANRSVIMKLKVSRNAPSVSAATGNIVGIDKNEANTEALVRDGETLVLGGIYVVDSANSQSKTPFLADVPILGVAFRSRSIKDIRRELLIFVTPRIIQGTPGTTDL